MKGRFSSPVLHISHTVGGERRGALGTAKLVLLQEQHRCRRLRIWQPVPLHSQANRRWRELPEQESSHNPAQQPRHKCLSAGHWRAVLQAPCPDHSTPPAGDGRRGRLGTLGHQWPCPTASVSNGGRREVERWSARWLIGGQEQAIKVWHTQMWRF